MQNRTPLISIIVPCYKVEQYLDECVTSIINQTYTNLEIILVDDGSPDNVPKMCDEWAKKDSRIKVIHKSNGGLSDARNAGLGIYSGEFVSFVDSDDFIEKDMIDVLYNLYKSTRADVCACKIQRYIQSTKKIEPINYFKYSNCYDSKSYIKNLLLRKIDCASWNKLYTKEFIGNSKFIKGRNNEDIIWLFFRFYENNFRVAYTDRILYNYRRTPNSITTSGLNPHFFDSFINSVEMEQYDFSHKRIYLSELKNLKLKISIDLYWNVYISKDNKKYATQSKELLMTIRKNFFGILFSKWLNIKHKIKSIIVLGANIIK